MGLELSHVFKEYPDTEIFEDVSVSIPSIGLVVLCGENGAGKTTLLNILSGKDADYSGSLFYNGILIDDDNRLQYSENEVSYVTQDSLVFDDISVLDNLLLPFDVKDEKRALDILDSLSLSELKNQVGSQLSGGEKQRLSLGRILYQPKAVILLDELTAHLDDESTTIIIKKIIELSKSHLVLFVSHDERVKNLPEAKIMRIENKKIQIDKDGFSNEKISNSSDFLKPSKSLLKQSFKREKSSHLLLGVVSLIVTFISLFFGNIGSSFYSGGSKNMHAKKIEEVFSSTATALPSLEENGYEGIKYPLVSDLTFRLTTDYESFSEGLFFSGFFAYDSKMDSDIELTLGDYPKQDGEAIISDVCARNINDFSLGNTIHTDRLYKIVGVYKARESSVDIRYQKAEGDIKSLCRICYAFLTESVFVKTSSYKSSINLYLNSEKNRHAFLDADKDNHFYSYLDIQIVTSDENGEKSLVMFDYASIYYVISIAFVIGYILFLIVYIIAFAMRNKRKYILLRFMGMSRKRLTDENIKLFGFNFAFTSTISILLNVIAYVVLNCIFASKLYGSSLWVVDFNLIMMAILIASQILFLIAFGLVLTKYLSPMDFTEVIDEVKEK